MVVSGPLYSDKLLVFTLFHLQTDLFLTNRAVNAPWYREMTRVERRQYTIAVEEK